MNLSTDQASIAVDEIAPPSQPHCLSTSCDLHPYERFSSFCPSCLCQRLSVLDHTGAPPLSLSSSRKPPNISTAALKSLFKPSSSGNNNNNNANGRCLPGAPTYESFSAKINQGFSGGFEPQRRPCDVRLRDEHRNILTKEAPSVVIFGGKNEDEEEEAETEKEEENRGHSEIVNDSGEKSGEDVEELKPMKDYMDLYPPQTKKPSFTRSLFSVASIFNKKLQKWKQKQKQKNVKKPRNGDGGGERPHFSAEENNHINRTTYSKLALFF